MSTPLALLRRAKDVFRTEGLPALLRRAFRLAGPWFFDCRRYYLYYHEVRELDEADFVPRIQGFTFKAICNNEEADELAATTGVDLRRRFVTARKRLDRGAIATCIVVNGEIAHIGWLALSEEAKKAVDSLPCRVDFSNREAYMTDAQTIPKYRGKGLMAYGGFRRMQVLRERGVLTARYTTAASNTVAQRALTRFSGRKYARARYVKLLWWKSWKETPDVQTG